jgi:hypothetical protein
VNLLYSAGDCTVCSTSGIAVVLASLRGGYVYHCPMCGIAWSEPPAAGVDEVLTVAEIAPAGVRLPSADEIQRLRDGGVHLVEVSYEEWADDLEAVLGTA